MVEEQEDVVAIVNIAADSLGIIGEVAPSQSRYGLFVGTVFGANHHTKVAGHHSRHVLQRYFRPIAVVGIGSIAVGDAIPYTWAVRLIAIEVIGAGSDVTHIGTPFATALEEVTLLRLLPVLCEGDADMLVGLFEE